MCSVMQWRLCSGEASHTRERHLRVDPCVCSTQLSFRQESSEERAFGTGGVLWHIGTRGGTQAITLTFTVTLSPTLTLAIA